jgi:hypothetical protein
MNKFQQAAATYMDCGYNPLPLYRGKKPMLEAGFTHFYEKHNDLEAFRGAQAIGIAGGDVSDNIFCIDFDQKEGNNVQDIFFYFIESKVFLEVAEKCAMYQTPSGGYHLIFKTTYSIPKQNLAIFKDGTVMIEIRGEGSYFACEPSERYTRIHDIGITEIERISGNQADALLKLAMSFSEQKDIRKVNEDGTKRMKKESWDINTPEGKYNEECAEEVKDLIINNGWRYVETRRDGVEYWTRPGKNPEDGHSATYGKFRHCFYVWTQNAYPLEAYTAYNPFEIYTIFEYGGDWKKAKDALCERFGMPKYQSKKEKEEQPSGIISNVSTTIETQSGTIENYDPGDHVTIEAILEAERVIINADDAAEAGDVCNEIYKYYGAEKKVYVRTPDCPDPIHGWKFYISVINDYINKWTDIQHDDFINKSLALRPLLSGHNLSNYTDAICDYFNLDLQSVEDDTRERKEKRKKEIQEKKQLALLSQIKDAADAGNMEAVKKLSYELNKTDAASDRLDFMQPYTRDLHIHEMHQKREGIYSGYDIEGSKLLIPATDILFIAGYTGMNKTGFLINLALNAIEHGEAKNKYLFLTMEQTKGDILNRFINTYVNIDRIGSYDENNTAALEYYYKNGADEKHLYDINRSEFLEKESRFFADILPKINIQYVEGTADSVIDAIREYKKAVPDLAGVFIDQMSFMVLSGEKKKKEKINSRQEELKHICDELKELKNNTHLSLIIAVQISRKGHESGLKDLTGISESGDIERVGHTILGIQDMRINNELKMVILKRRSDRTGIETKKIYIPYSRKITNEDAQYFVQNEDGDITEMGSKKTYSLNGTKAKKKAPKRHDAAMKRNNPDPDLLNYNNN